MATYYVDSVNGSDAFNGLGPDASHGTNKPWQTITKLLGAAGMSSGDTAYLSPSGPFREVVTVAMTSATAETQIIGDPSNAQGFKNSSGVLVEPDYVIWTGYTTNDTTAPATTSLLILSGRDFLTFQGIVLMGGSAQTGNVVLAAALSTDITFRRCIFIGGRFSTSQSIINVVGTGGSALNWLIDQCALDLSTHIAIDISLPTVASTDYDVNFVIRNSRIVSLAAGIRVTPSGALSNKPGGVDILNCDIITNNLAFQANGANMSTTIPCTVTNSKILCGNSALVATTTGQIVEDWNWIAGSIPRTNVSSGSNSVAVASSAITHAPLFEVGQASVQGFLPRYHMTPMEGSPLLNFGSSGAPSVDMLNRPRPAGSGIGASSGILTAVGALERHDTAVQETTTVDASGSGIVIVGPGDHDLKVPVDASATTISIKARYDTTHAATNKPQVLLLANAKLGVTAETLTMTAAVDTWETLTTASQTPTAKGVLTLRLVSRAAAGGGKAFFDTVS